MRVCKNVKSRVVVWPSPSLTHSLTHTHTLSLSVCQSHTPSPSFSTFFLSVSLHPKNNRTIVKRTAGLQLKLSVFLTPFLSPSLSLMMFDSCDEMRHTHTYPTRLLWQLEPIIATLWFQHMWHTHCARMREPLHRTLTHNQLREREDVCVCVCVCVCCGCVCVYVFVLVRTSLRGIYIKLSRAETKPTHILCKTIDGRTDIQL